MNKAISIPNNLNTHSENNNLTQNLLSKSPSYDSLIDIQHKFTVELEGDGELGIRFKKLNNKIIVAKIDKNTVANEYYQIKEDLVVRKINNYLTKNYTYKEIINILDIIWKKESRVLIEFSQEIVYKHIYNYLDNLNCSQYYEKFIKLGAKDLSDLRYIEYDDLVKMDICYEDRKKISIKLGLKYNLVIPKNNSEVFELESPLKFNKMREEEKINILKSQKFKKDKDNSNDR